MGIFPEPWSMADENAWYATLAERKHSLPANDLFSTPALAKLIEAYPRDRYMLVHTGPVGTAKKLWQQGDIGKLPGDVVLEAIQRGNLWLALFHIEEAQADYRELVEATFGEMDRRTQAGFPTFNHIGDILISSPGAQVYYHFDQNGQTLWQIRGSKRVLVYPNTPPYLTVEAHERVAVFADETGIPYRPDFDAAATEFILESGKMLHWPLFSPHRVENREFSISLTTQYYTPMIRRLAKVYAANGLLHQAMPRLRLASRIDGGGYAAKALLQASARRLGIIDRFKKTKLERVFTLDPANLGSVAPL